MLSRAEWGMPGPLGRRMRSSRGLWLHHSVTKATSDAKADARRIANIGIQRFGRLSYSFIVHPDGTILEGQNGHVGAHTRGQNSTSQAICCVGNFENDAVTPEMVAAIRLLVRNYGPLLGGHRDAPGASTACPGRNLYAMVGSLRVPVAPVGAVPVRPVLRQGARGEHVRTVQSVVGVAVDGVFGPRTDAAVKAFQRGRGLVADGIVGPATWRALGV
jgi:hypothetical protein